MDKPQIILGIESSCDETAASIIQKTEEGVKMLSNVVATSLAIQAKYGGIVPEQAAREQLKSIIPVIEESLRQAQCKSSDLDAIAVTQGPGLVGSLLVGMETAKTLSLVWQKPLVPINHLVGHFYANWISNTPPQFPAIGLLVSGGHTDLILMEGHGKYKYLGGTRDDAAGECFDKCARLLGLPYPGGPVISKLAEDGNPKAYKLPRPMWDSKDLDFSFSGLKTAVANLIQNNPLIEIKDLAASVEKAIIDVLVKKTIQAAKINQVNQIIVAGGVAANKHLKEALEKAVEQEIPNGKLFVPPPYLCTDNAAYIATTAFFNYHPIDPLKLEVNPNLSLVK